MSSKTESIRPPKPKSSKAPYAWAEFLTRIEEARKQVGCADGDNAEAWFRGHTRSDYQLMPSLFRARKNPDSEASWKEIFNKESDLFWEFAARARELHGVVEDDWDILFAMQHYGTPTRLLDWTEAFAVALYFATLGVDENKRVYPDGCQRDDQGNPVPPPCIWVLNPYRLNDVPRWKQIEGAEADAVHPTNLGWDAKEGEYYSYGELLCEGYMDWDRPTAIYPRQRNARIHAQRAWFTIHGDKFRPMEEFGGRTKHLSKVGLPFVAVKAAKDFLKLAGINHYLLFADLESLSLHLQEKNGIITRSQAEAKARAHVERRDVVPNPRPR
jgi:hypothetical protein